MVLEIQLYLTSAQAADFTNGDDKSKHTTNQQPRTAFDGHQNTQRQHGAHSHPNTNRVK